MLGLKERAGSAIRALESSDLEPQAGWSLKQLAEQCKPNECCIILKMLLEGKRGQSGQRDAFYAQHPTLLTTLCAPCRLVGVWTPVCKEQVSRGLAHMAQ